MADYSAMRNNIIIYKFYLFVLENRKKKILLIVKNLYIPLILYNILYLNNLNTKINIRIILN